jgi:hypothetical protein
VTQTVSLPAGEGDHRKQEQLARLADRRAVYVRRGRRALLLQLLAGATATADDVRAAVQLPSDIDPRCLGAVPIALAEAGIIVRVDYTPSMRPERHASIIAVWCLADRAAAMAWLADNPDLPDPDLTPEPGYLF